MEETIRGLDNPSKVIIIIVILTGGLVQGIYLVIQTPLNGPTKELKANILGGFVAIFALMGSG